jgi:WD40 repeat protein/DNA-binding SARP family transcriptional activator/tRNA A-37 threonylcarbamoyl transferase component Bud32
MELLWPGLPKRSARGNLRQNLYYLRKEIPEVSPGRTDDGLAVELIIANRQSIQLNPAASVNVDARRLAEMVEKTQFHRHADLLVCQQCRQDLEAAVALYKGNFLSDFHLDDSDVYENWSQLKRDSYRRMALDALENLTTILTRQKEFAEAKSYAERQLDIDNLRESAYRQLMEIVTLSGRKEEALAVYENAKRLLLEELGMAPSRRTTELYEQILAGELTFRNDLARGLRGYELKDEIAEGGYGAVHRAIQPSVNREVAVKVIRRRYANEPEFIRRFEAEAQTVARLEHPYIVPLYDYWRDPDGAYLVMRYLKGGSLLAALERGPWDPEPAGRMLDQIAGALSVAHRQGIVHRDIKPANILLDESGNTYLGDFGIAKDLTEDTQLTQQGVIVGTFDYISPEQILSKQLTPQSDIYSLGAVLYETLTGEKPFMDSTQANLIHRHLNEKIPLVTASRPDLSPDIDLIIQKATAKRPFERYGDALEMAEAFRTVITGLDPSLAETEAAVAREVTEVYNPYKGLRSFQEADRDDFFGREALTEQLVSRLAQSRFLAVVGPSGSGKSSAVKAGLIPALREKAIPGSEKWFVAEMVPGTHPLEELELALRPVAVDPPPSLVAPMERDTRGMLRTIRRILPVDGPNTSQAQLLLVIDQFEELFTLVGDDDQREFFINSLLAALRAPRSPLRVVITLRADFYDRPLQYESLGQLVKENTDVVLPLTAEELSWAVSEPVRRVGVGLEKGLTETIVADVAEQPGALPLLQYALTELFERRSDNKMTRAAYEGIGGVMGALGRRAEEIYRDLDEDAREATRQIFLRLVTLGEGVEDTRRRVLRSELESFQTSVVSETSADPHGVINRFGSARLLTFDHDPITRSPTVEVAHEALLREWGRLRGWLDESRYDVRLQRMLALAAAEWRAAGRAEGYFLRDARLDRFSGWVEGSSVVLTGDENDFLEASIASRETRLAKEEARRQRELETAQKLAETEHARARQERQRAEEQAQAAGRLRKRAIFLTGALALAALLAMAAVFFANRSIGSAEKAQSSANLAATREAEAIISADLATTREAEALAAADDRATAQAQAEQERIRADQQRMAADEARTEAESQASLARSRELANAALLNLETDSELSILLSVAAYQEYPSGEAVQALHKALPASRAVQRLQTDHFIFPVRFSPDGSRVVSGGGAQAEVWDVKSGEILFELEGHTEFINQLDYSPDGILIASTDDDGTARVWDATNGQLLAELANHNVIVQSIRFSPDGSLLATGDVGNVRLWDVATILEDDQADPVRIFSGHSGDDVLVWNINFSPDGTRLATSGDDAVRVWDPSTGDEIVQLVGVGIGLFSADGTKLLADGPTGGTISFYDAISGQLLFTSDRTQNNVTGLALSPDGRRLIAVNSNESNAQIWSVQDVLVVDQPLLSSSEHKFVWADFSPDGDFVVTSGGADQSAVIWDLTDRGNREILTSINHDGTVTGLDISSDGQRLASSSVDGSSVVLDVDTGQLLFRLEDQGETMTDIDFSPDGSLVATSSEDAKARLWDANTGELLQVLEGHNIRDAGFYRGMRQLAFSPDGDRLATAGMDGTLRLWAVSTGEQLMMFEAADTIMVDAPRPQFDDVEFSADGRFLVSGEPGAARIRDAITGKELFTIFHDRRVFEVAISPDGKLFALGDPTGLVRVFHVPQEKPISEPIILNESLHDIRPISKWIGSVDFSPDGELLLVSYDGEAARLFDINSGEELTAIDLPNGVFPAQIGPDGRQIAIGDNAGAVRIYTLDEDELLNLARSRVTRTLTDEECRRYLHLDACPAQE